MKRNESIARIGSIWYITDCASVVTNIYYFGSKQANTLLSCKREICTLFSSSETLINALLIEIIVGSKSLDLVFKD